MRVLRVCARVVGLIGFIGLRLAVHRHQVHTPALSGPCSAALHTARPPFGCLLKLRRLSWYLSAVRLPQSAPCASPAPPLFAKRGTAGRAWYAGAPPWGAARLATLGCAAVMLFAGQHTRPTRSKKPAIRLRGTDWCLRLPIVRLPAPALGWHGAFGGGGPFRSSRARLRWSGSTGHEAVVF